MKDLAGHIFDTFPTFGGSLTRKNTNPTTIDCFVCEVLETYYIILMMCLQKMQWFIC